MKTNTEIEIRFPLDEKTFYKIRKKLKKTANFVKKLQQKDKYFTPAHRNFVNYHPLKRAASPR
jgi:adenylate cyclase class IV